MIDIDRETLIAFQKAPGLIPGRPHLSTLHRWRLRGVHGIRLESCLLAGRRFTSREALNRFFDRTTAVGEGHQPHPHTTRQRHLAQEQARTALQQAGIIGTPTNKSKGAGA